MNFLILWGAATSAHQVEGDNVASDWWAWEKQGKIQVPSGKACDQYRRFEEDIALMARLGHTAHRFSLEWSRFEPEEGSWNDEAFAHYEAVFQALERHKIEPVVTLHHFTHPRWFHEQGGWLHEEGVRRFERYVKKVVTAYGRYVRFWITINEPLILLYYGYYTGLWPPGYKSFTDSLRVFRMLVEAHLVAYRTIHRIYEVMGKGPVWVSLAKHMIWFSPCRKASWLDWLAVRLRDEFFNQGFLKAVTDGFLFFPGIFCDFFSGCRALDFLAVNYYSRNFIRFAGLGGDRSIGEICDNAHHAAERQETNMLGWEVYPEGLYLLLKRLQRYRLPLMITENGICTENDHERVRFIQDHLEAVRRAVKEGVPVQGYFYWSLLDNFEWAHGFRPRFGIVGVDYTTQQRIVRPSAQILSDLCRNL